MLAESKTIYAIKESLSKSIDSESGLIAFKNQILAKSKVSISDPALNFNGPLFIIIPDI